MQGTFTYLNVYFNTFPLESFMYIIAKKLFCSKHQQKTKNNVAKLQIALWHLHEM
jgi:hypothetical protein